MKTFTLLFLLLGLIGCGRSGDLTLNDDTANATVNMTNTASLTIDSNIDTNKQMILDVQVQSSE